MKKVRYVEFVNRVPVDLTVDGFIATYEQRLAQFKIWKERGVTYAESVSTALNRNAVDSVTTRVIFAVPEELEDEYLGDCVSYFGASCQVDDDSAVSVSKEAFDDFIATYPRPLSKSYMGIADAYVYADMSINPDDYMKSIVASHTDPRFVEAMGMAPDSIDYRIWKPTSAVSQNTTQNVPSGK